ncbi:hypothetical protein SDC9_191416 [bioreactor metagenome]|uniref:Uncharacterized protein n=1 Tax=bioreactor metagenome TaxID=1076179 RepID=A0A645HXT7_9ZZZZ
MTLPCTAMGAPTPAAMTRKVPQKKLSPIPARGPIRAVLTALMEEGSMLSGLLAYSSSMAQLMPKQKGTKEQVVLKNML